MPDPCKPALLLLDDDAIVREVLLAGLAAAGYDVVAVARIGDAVEQAMARHFDCMLIDQRLGDGNGIAALHALRRCTGTRAARALAISAELDDADRKRLREAGFEAGVQKPVEIAELLALITNSTSTGKATLPPADATDDILDDGVALAQWGSTDTVRTLRAMLLPELDAYRAALEDCRTTRDPGRLHDILHRMRSSAGFCGALGLTRFIDATTFDDALDWQALLDRYDATVARLRPALQARLAA